MNLVKMTGQPIYLQYLPEYNVFAISDEDVAKYEGQNTVPYISLNPADYQLLQEPLPTKEMPTVGFLCCREQNYYSVDFNYAKSLAHSGVNLCFLTYRDCVAQMQDIDALMLPGGRFASPPEFYIKPLPEYPPAGLRAQSYIACIKEAQKRRLPMLGVCAGAQMIACMHGFKLYHNIADSVSTDLEHKTPQLEAHTIQIKPQSLLHRLLEITETVVNSRHVEAIVNDGADSDLEIYAFAPDDVPEAWGSETQNILCIQWHPEDFAAAGNQKMQNLYNWLAEQATIYHAQK